jgi:hypothetical protein
MSLSEGVLQNGVSGTSPQPISVDQRKTNKCTGYQLHTLAYYVLRIRVPTRSSIREV